MDPEFGLRRAIRTFDFFARHARAAFDLAAHSGTPLTDADYVLAMIRRKDWTRFTKQEIWQACRGRFDKTARLETALSVLVARGALIESVPERRGPGRPPAPTYRVVAASAVKPDIGVMKTEPAVVTSRARPEVGKDRAGRIEKEVPQDLPVDQGGRSPYFPGMNRSPSARERVAKN